MAEIGSLTKKENMKIESKVETTNIMDVELATYDGEKWFIRNIEQRKSIGIFGTYSLEEWKSILSVVFKEKEG